MLRDPSVLVLCSCGLLIFDLISNCCISSLTWWADQEPAAATTLLDDTPWTQKGSTLWTWSRLKICTMNGQTHSHGWEEGRH